MSPETVGIWVSAIVVILNTIASMIAAYQSKRNQFQIELAQLQLENSRQEAQRAHQNLKQELKEEIQSIPTNGA